MPSASSPQPCDARSFQRYTTTCSSATRRRLEPLSHPLPRLPPSTLFATSHHHPETPSFQPIYILALACPKRSSFEVALARATPALASPEHLALTRPLFGAHAHWLRARSGRDGSTQSAIQPHTRLSYICILPCVVFSLPSLRLSHLLQMSPKPRFPIRSFRCAYLT